MGDKADLSSNDFLRFWEQDPGTDAVLLYLESLGNPRRFGPAQRGGSPRPSPSSSSRAGAPWRGGERPGRTPAPCWRPRRPPSTPSLTTPASSASRPARRAARRRRAARAPAAARPPTRGDRDQRRRPRDRLRRRSAAPPACTLSRLQEATRRALAQAASRGRGHGEPRRHARRRHRRGLPPTIETVAADPGVDAIIAIFIQALPRPGRGPGAARGPRRRAAAPGRPRRRRSS